MILFIHIPGFYAAVEQADDHALAGQPVIVGGDPRKRGLVTSASAEAAGLGVLPGMEVSAALACAPEAVLRPTRLKRYREVAAETRVLLRGTTDRLEELGLDGTFVAAPSGAEELPLAAELCVRLQSELGLRAVAGIGPTRFVAYQGAVHAGPGGITRVDPERARAYLRPFPLTDIWGLGPHTAKRLGAAGLHTIGDVADAKPEELEALAGRNARSFQELARAEPDAPIRRRAPAKSVSQERTLRVATVDLRLIGDELLELAHQLEAVLARERRAARTVTLGLAFVDGNQISRTQTLDQPIDAQSEIGETALHLLARTQAGARRVRRLKLAVSNLLLRDAEADPRQLRLF